jgi:hypothetical protein
MVLNEKMNTNGYSTFCVPGIKRISALAEIYSMFGPKNRLLDVAFTQAIPK